MKNIKAKKYETLFKWIKITFIKLMFKGYSAGTAHYNK